jgi:hypothetical protein
MNVTSAQGFFAASPVHWKCSKFRERSGKKEKAVLLTNGLGDVTKLDRGKAPVLFTSDWHGYGPGVIQSFLSQWQPEKGAPPCDLSTSASGSSVCGSFFSVAGLLCSLELRLFLSSCIAAPPEAPSSPLYTIILIPTFHPQRHTAPGLASEPLATARVRRDIHGVVLEI